MISEKENPPFAPTFFKKGLAEKSSGRKPPGNLHMTLRRGQIIIVLFSVWILAIILPNLRFAPGNWEAMHQRLGQSLPSSETLLGAILVLAVIFLGGLVLMVWKWRRRGRKGEELYQMYREPVRLPASVPVVFLLFLVAMAGMIWWARQPSKVEKTAPPPHFAAQSEKQPAKAPPKVSPQALPEARPFQSVWVGYILAIGLLAGLSWIVRRWLKERPKDKELGIADVGQIVARAALDLEKGADLSDVVLRCYRDMCNILRRKVVLRQEMTAREFAQHLQEAGVREEEVARLTTLFEKVRYGRYVANPEERAEAIGLLQAIENQYGKVGNET